MMLPVITSIKPELRSKGLDRRRCCWHVSYQFCDLSAEITVYAESEADAQAGAALVFGPRRDDRPSRRTYR